MIRTAEHILADLQLAGDEPMPIEPTDRPGVIRWEEPPPRDRRGNPGHPAPESKYAPIAKELRARPGEWALVYVGTKVKATSLANSIRFASNTAFRPAYDFEAVTRTIAGRTRCYARYVGDQG